ncbi:PASTA domain-containing protein [candidate division KSB1 bacterium]|nr:PASTA domain-containing protein [candidate division KSB1 bacterium]
MKKIDWRTVFSPVNLKFAGIVCAIFVVFLLMLDNLIMPLLTRHWQSISVPEVTNLSWNAAEKILQDAGLQAIKAAEKYDPHLPPGFVLFQNPEAGSPVKKGRRIYLTVGKGERIFEMPRFVGMSLRDAQFILNDYSLQLGKLEYETDDYWPDGVISHQSIAAGREISAGQVINLTISLGSAPTIFIVPRLVGRSLDDAVIEIKKAGLVLGQISYQTTEKLVPETVIGQSPHEGLEVAEGDSVRLIVCQLPKSEAQGVREEW